jgi:predicted P-type ATPase
MVETTPRLRDHFILQVENSPIGPRGDHPQLVYAPNEYKHIYPYAFSRVRVCLYWFLVICSGGILLILTVWFPQLYTYLARTRLPLSSLGSAQYLLVELMDDHDVDPDEKEENKKNQSWHGSFIEVVVHHQEEEKKEEEKNTPWIWFEFKKNRYVFNPDKQTFERYLSTIKEEFSFFYRKERQTKGLNEKQISTRLCLFGTNHVDLEPTPIYELLFVKIVHPFYLFQVFSATVWFIQAYTIYAITILVLSAVSMFWEIYSEVINVKRLRSLVRSNRQVQVIRTLPCSSSTDSTKSNSTTSQQQEEQDQPDLVVNPRDIHTIHEQNLVPGDVVLIEEGIVVADILLLVGDCVVDESNLTGEAIPINKRAINNHNSMNTTTTTTTFSKNHQDKGNQSKFFLTEHFARTELKESFLHAGSTVTRIRTNKKNKYCRGIVLSTGFSTGKGELFRSIIFPKKITFEFERDSYRYLCMLVTIALCAFTKRLIEGQKEGVSFGNILVKSLDLITVAVPPALPLVLSAGIGIAQKKLMNSGIFCIESTRINCSGQLSLFCFDKTGTLTKDHLTLKGIDRMSCSSTTFNSSPLPQIENIELEVKNLPQMFQIALATCHGLSQTENDQLVGYSLEIEMFQSTGYKLEIFQDTTNLEHHHKYSAIVTCPQDDKKYGILKKFPFDAVYQRSSVIVEEISTKKCFFFVKGSPEAIKQIAVGSTIPSDFEKQALVYSSQGYYCIAFGMREVSKGDGDQIGHFERKDVEKEISFMGFSLFINEVKPESKGLIQQLYEANIDVRIITGDNALTTVHVAKQLALQLQENIAIVKVNDTDQQMVYHSVDDILKGQANKWQVFTAATMNHLLTEYDLAITGEVLEKIHIEFGEKALREILVNTKIFARVRPQQKAWIVTKLMEMGHIVGMTGDGTNDCGALKAAHVGLALSNADASIVAPFTSKQKNICDVMTLLREGRCAITTSFLGFKYMVLYPIIQLAMASTLAHTEISLSNNQYMWDDLAIVLGLSLTMLYTNASTRLTKERPAHTLFSMSIVSSLIGQITLFLVFFASGYAFLYQQKWFCSQANGVEYLNGNNTIASCQAYEKIPQYEDDIFDSFENSVIWLYGHMFYFSVAAAFNVKDAFRLAFYTNWLYTSFFLLSLSVNLWFLLDPSGTIDATFQTVALPFSFRLKLLALFGGNFLCSILWEWTTRRWFPVYFRPTKMDKYSKSYLIKPSN